MENMESARKVDPSTVEVLGSSGEVLKERARETVRPDSGEGFQKGFRGIRMIQGGPALLLLLPLFIPLALISMMVMGFVALFFGRSVVRVVSTGLRRR
jgi:hypothetical protein